MEDVVRQVTARVMAALAAGEPCGHTSAEGSVSSHAYRHGVTVGVSNRHVHLDAASLETLFGPGYELEPFKELSQPGEFASSAFVDIEHDGYRIERLRVLGPLRGKTQIELSETDARSLKMTLPVRSSGKLEGTPGLRISGPAGSLDLKEGCIIASRHIHLHSSDAQRLGVKDGQTVHVRMLGEKSGVIGDVVCRVSDRYSFELHIDTDDANAFLQKTGDIAEILLEPFYFNHKEEAYVVRNDNR